MDNVLYAPVELWKNNEMDLDYHMVLENCSHTSHTHGSRTLA